MPLNFKQQINVTIFTCQCIPTSLDVPRCQCQIASNDISIIIGIDICLGLYFVLVLVMPEQCDHSVVSLLTGSLQKWRALLLKLLLVLLLSSTNVSPNKFSASVT